MSAAETAASNQQQKTSLPHDDKNEHICENQCDVIELEVSEYPIIFTDKRGIALIAFVALGLAFGLNSVYPFIYDGASL